MRSEESVGGGNPQPNIINQPNNRSNLCRKCEYTPSDRKYSPKTGLVVLTSPVFVTEEGGN